MRRRTFLNLAGGGTAAIALPRAAAQSSAPPVRLLVGFAAGGSVDALARLLGEQLREPLGRTVVVENRTGAAGRLALEALKAAPPDGDTLAIAPHGPMTLFPHLYRSLRFDPTKDFTAISRLTTTDYCLAVGPQVPAGDVGAFVRWAKAQGDSIAYGSPGAGTVPHFVGVQIARAIGVPMRHVAYRGAAPALVDVAGGTITGAVTPLTDPLEMHRAGRVRIVATTGAARSTLVPGLPTFREAGVEVEVDGWNALYGPAGLPEALVQRLQSAVRTVLEAPAMRERLAAMGLQAAPAPTAELLALTRREAAMWGPVVKASGFTPED